LVVAISESFIIALLNRDKDKLEVPSVQRDISMTKSRCDVAESWPSVSVAVTNWADSLGLPVPWNSPLFLAYEMRDGGNYTPPPPFSTALEQLKFFSQRGRESGEKHLLFALVYLGLSLIPALSLNLIIALHRSLNGPFICHCHPPPRSLVFGDQCNWVANKNLTSLFAQSAQRNPNKLHLHTVAAVVNNA